MSTTIPTGAVASMLNEWGTCIDIIVYMGICMKENGIQGY